MSNNYNTANIATMELIYGEGYLSAGGDREIARLFGQVDVAGKSVLDVGCGLGGAAVTLARDLGAGHVYGIDIDQGVLSRARELVARNHVGDRVTLSQVEPGPFPFPDQHFDLVHLTAVACHFDDLAPLFCDIYRVLKPGGMLVGRDWLKIGENEEYQRWDRLLRDRGLNFYFVDQKWFSKSLESAGFAEIVFEDRTQDIADMALQSVQFVKSGLRDSLVEVLGEEGYSECLKWTEIRADALSRGGIGQSQFTAACPARREN